jgi:hypothetical protein
MKTTQLAGLSALAVMCLSSVAHADDPKFEYGKSDDLKDVKAVIWKAAAQAGFVLTSGNSHTTTVSGGLVASRKEGDNKLSIEANAAYGKSELKIFVPIDADNLVGPGEIRTANQETTNAWLAKLRYDRFLTEHNSLFVTARIGADKIAGKTLIAGGQLGYSRLLFKSDTQELASEIGYDFSYESYAANDTDSLSIHSARLFLGYTGKLSADTSLGAAVEWLTNLNAEDTAPNDRNDDGYADATLGIDALKDNRVMAKAELTTKVRSNMSFRFSFTAKGDSAPANLPNVKGTDGYAPGFQPVAEKLDTITEAQLIIDLL